MISQYTQDSPDAAFRYPLRAWTQTDPALKEVISEPLVTPGPDRVYKVTGKLDPSCSDVGKKADAKAGNNTAAGEKRRAIRTAGEKNSGDVSRARCERHPGSPSCRCRRLRQRRGAAHPRCKSAVGVSRERCACSSSRCAPPSLRSRPPRRRGAVRGIGSRPRPRPCRPQRPPCRRRAQWPVATTRSSRCRSTRDGWRRRRRPVGRSPSIGRGGGV